MTMFYGSRFAPKSTGARVAPVRPAGRTLAEALRDPAAVLRVTVRWDPSDRPVWSVQAWTDRYATVDLDQAAQQQLLAWLREIAPAVNFWRPVQYDLRTGQLGAAPAVEDDGGIPELDLSFGEPRPPVLADYTTPPLPFATPETTRRAA